MHTKRPGKIELRGQRVKVSPELTRDLEVVALVPDDVEVRSISAERKVFSRRIGAQGLVRLTVRIAPEMAEPRARGRDPHRI
jgi:hypothetical protein